MEPVRGRSRGFWLAGAVLLFLTQSGAEKALRKITKICLQPPEEGPCRALLGRWFYNITSQTCEEFSYGGCLGNENRFLSLEECSSFCGRIEKVPRKCRPEANSGRCKAYIEQFYFNLESMKCEKFIYGGCGGNVNRFGTAKACRNFCIKDIPSMCNSPKDEGSCSASIPRFYYNKDEHKCEQFTWTGCGGNNNNFVSERDCYKTCRIGKGKRKDQKYLDA
uniref:Tissue factor pathway inhibitor n=1 Tax=Salvator merianae TaxID=96440 RepID=A0A8D0BWN7_SALMN